MGGGGSDWLRARALLRLAVSCSALGRRRHLGRSCDTGRVGARRWVRVTVGTSYARMRTHSAVWKTVSFIPKQLENLHAATPHRMERRRATLAAALVVLVGGQCWQC